MNQEKLTESIKENKGILRQLTSLNNEVKELKGRVKKLEQTKKGLVYSMKKFKPIVEGIEIPIEIMSDKEIENIKVGGTDPD